MKTAALVALLSVSALAADDLGRYWRTCNRTSTGRSTRGLQCETRYAQFEFAPASGKGMSAPCACTNVTAATGEAVAWGRGSSGACTKSASELSIAPGDMAICGVNLPRVMAGNSGSVGVLSEQTTTNIALRSEEFENAAYISTAAVTADQALGPTNALTMDTLNDSSAVVQQGSCQTITTAALQRHSTSVYVSGGTATSATVTQTGVGNAVGDCTNTATGLVAGTIQRLGCVGAAYTAGLTAVIVCVTVGTVVATTGTIQAWGMQHENRDWSSSYVATTNATVSRSADTGGTATMSAAIGPSFSMAASVVFQAALVGAVAILRLGGSASDDALVYRNADTTAGYQIVGTSTTPGVAAMGTAEHRTALFDNAGTRGAFWDGASVSAPAATMSNSEATVYMGASHVGTAATQGVVKLICLDSDATRCR